MKKRYMLGFGLVTALSLAACAPMATTEVPAPATPGTIVDVAVANGSFTTLVAAVKAAGLAEVLSGPGPFTVFAPTDAAFKKLPAGTVDTLLLPANKATLVNILKYHVVSGKVEAAKVVTLKSATTLAGQDVTITVTGSKVSLTDAKGGVSNVTMTDVQASNGVIHVIDAVLMPK